MKKNTLRFDVAFNRTILELKQYEAYLQHKGIETFNRTILELKQTK